MQTADQFHTYHEIISQTHAWQAALQETSNKADQLLALWNAQPFQTVIFTGCGSTYYLARAAALLFQGSVRTTAVAYPASDILLYPDLVLRGGEPKLLVAISRSGETTETLRAVDLFRAHTKGPVIGITCYEHSSLSKSVSLAIVIGEAQEYSVAQTRSFSSMLVAVQALTILLGSRKWSSPFLQLPVYGVDLIAEYHDLARKLGEDVTLERFFFLGSGPYYGLACEAMLKMKEMSLSYSEAFHFLEFRHGPMSMVNQQTLIAGLVSETALSPEVKLLEEMRALGARVLAITPRLLKPEQADFQVVLPGGLQDGERAILYLPVLQLMAFYRSLHNGLNPDQPANLMAVVQLKLP